MGLKTRKAAEVAAKQQVKIETDAKKHLLVKMDVNRDVREAYLHGLVFAGLANDDDEPEIQSEERSVLDEICASLEVGLSLIDEIIAAEKTSIDDDTYKDLLRECLVLFSDIKMYDAFLEDFDKVWSVGKGNPAELKSWHNDFEEMVSADVAKVLEERKSIEAKKAEEENVKRAAAEAARRKAEQETQKAAAETELHKLQSEIASECDEWGSLHSEWVEVIKKRMSQHHVELLDLKSDAKKVLNEKCCRDFGSLYGIFGAMVTNKKSSQQLTMWGGTSGERKKIGKIVVLLVCKYMRSAKSFRRFGGLDSMLEEMVDDMFKVANRRSIEDDLKQLVKSEFGVSGEKTALGSCGSTAGLSQVTPKKKHVAARK